MSCKHGSTYASATAVLAALLYVVTTLPIVNAQSINPSLDDIFQLRAGPFFANFETTVDIQDLPFDQEQLGDNQTTVAGFIRWRITPKFHLNLV